MSKGAADIGAVIARPDHGGCLDLGAAARANATFHRLRDQLERYHVERVRRAGWERRFISTGLTPLDERLPHGGLPCGAVTEIMADSPGVGAMSLAMRIAKRCMEESTSTLRASVPPCLRALVVMDTRGDFYPPAAVQCGVPCDHLIVLRARNEQEAFWAADQALRCSAVGAVIAPLGTLNDRLARRLQLAAESSGCVGLILRAANKPTHRFAAVRMRIEALPIANFQLPIEKWGHSNNWQSAIGNRQFPCRLTLLTVREGSPAEPFLVDLNHETGLGSIPAVSVDRTAMRIAN